MGRPGGLGHPTINLKIGAVAVSEGDALKGATAKMADALVAITDGAALVGFAEADIAATAYGPVGVGGIWQVDAAAAFTPVGGKQAVAASATTFDAGTAADPVAGFVVNADQAADALFDMLITSVVWAPQAV